MTLTRLIASVVSAVRGEVLRAPVIAILCVAVSCVTGGFVKAADIPTDMRIDWGNVVVSKDELVCLALNDYWEARSEVVAGRLAVGRVVLNRAMDPRFPSNLCEVIKQSKLGATGSKSVCQFSWVCEGKTDVPDSKEWRDSIKIAVALVQKDSSIPDPTGGALWYHADFTRPVWAAGFESTTIIGTHVFYREPDGPHAAPAPRKPFIYRLNAFAEFVALRNSRAQVAAVRQASRELSRDGSSAIAMKTSAIVSQPIAR